MKEKTMSNTLETDDKGFAEQFNITGSDFQRLKKTISSKHGKRFKNNPHKPKKHKENDDIHFKGDNLDFPRVTQTLSMESNYGGGNIPNPLTINEDDDIVMDDDWEHLFLKSQTLSDNLSTSNACWNSPAEEVHAIVDSSKTLNSENCLQENNNESDEDDNLALQIAEDLSTRKKLIIIDRTLYYYNNQFFEQLREYDAQRLIFSLYKEKVRKGNTVSLVKNVSLLLMLTAKYKLDEFPSNERIIVFKNGTLDIRNNKFRKNSPNDFAVSGLGINYQPDNYEMPNTERFLRTIADGDSDLYKLLLQVIGYILSNDMRAKSFFYLEGVGNAGKSRFCDLIASFFPTTGANKVARIALQDLGKQFSLGNLVHAKLNISEDLPDTPLSPTTVSRIKMLSDANRLEAEAKYVQAFSFRPQCKLLFASNHPLRLKEYDEAFANRVVYIPFLKAIPKEKQDKFILEKMQNELPALFNNALKAYKELVINRYVWAGSDKFTPNIICKTPPSVDKEVVLKHFVSCCCEFDENSITSIKDLQVAYNAFCYENSYQPVVGDRFSREIFPVLPDVVERVKISNQKRGFKGIRLRSNDVF